jgi:hypothetical protein
MASITAGGESFKNHLTQAGLSADVYRATCMHRSAGARQTIVQNLRSPAGLCRGALAGSAGACMDLRAKQLKSKRLKTLTLHIFEIWKDKVIVRYMLWSYK